MSSATSSNPPCPILEGPSNFTIWNIRIKGVLSKKQVLGVVTGTDPKLTAPSSISTAAATGSASTSSSISKTGYSDTWEARNEKALGLIQCYMSNSILLSIGTKEVAKELYDAIVRRYNETNVVTTAFHALGDLISLKYEGTPSAKTMSEHTAKFLASKNRLTTLGYTLHDDLLPLLLLKSVPDDENWRTLKTAITGSVVDGSKLKLETVESRLESHATELQRIHEATNLPDTPSANVESALKASKLSKRKFYCKLHRNNLLHNTPECHNIVRKESDKPKDKVKRRKGWVKAHAVDNEESSDELDSEHEAHAVHTPKIAVNQQSWEKVYAYMMTKPNQKQGSIIIDCGATTHMTPHPEWFETESFKKLNPPHRVRFGDNTTADAIGIGNIWISSKVGNKRYKVCL
jgi:gag-polypeptide of LTR copia-type